VPSVQTVNGMHLFTTTGYKYFRSFQISLCAGGGDAGEFPPAACLNNASLEMQVCRFANHNGSGLRLIVPATVPRTDHVHITVSHATVNCHYA